MVRFLIDFVPGTEPAAGEYMFVSILTLILSLPWFYFCFLYIMRALGLYRIAKRRNIHNPWLAWIPCGCDWLLGSISDHYQHVTYGKHRYCRVLLLIVSMLTWAGVFLVKVFTWELPLQIMNIVYSDSLRRFLHLTFVSNNLLPVTTGLVVALILLRLIPLYRLYQSAMPRRRIPLLILNILVPFSPAVTIFAVRDYDQGMPPMHASAVDTLNEDQTQT